MNIISKAQIYVCSECDEEIRINEISENKVLSIFEESEWYVDEKTGKILCHCCSSAITCEECGEIRLLPEVVNYDNGPTTPEFHNSSWIFEDRIFFCCMHCKEVYMQELKILEEIIKED